MVRCQNCCEEDADSYMGVEHHGEKGEETGDGELVIFFGTGDPRAIEDRKRMKTSFLNMPGHRVEEKLVIS
jgi:hypothetical protein